MRGNGVPVCVIALLAAACWTVAVGQTMTVYTRSGSRYTYNTRDVDALGFGAVTATRSASAARPVVPRLSLAGSAAEGRFVLAGQPGTPYTFTVYNLLGELVYRTAGTVAPAATAQITVPGGITSTLCIVRVRCGSFKTTRRITTVK